MKILVVCQYYYPEQFRINDICKELKEKGNEVTVLTGLPNYPNGVVPKEYKYFKKRKENIDGINVIRCFEIGRRKGPIFRVLNYFSFAISGAIKAKHIKEEYDVIYVYQLSPVLMAVPGIKYKKKHNKKLVLYCLDLWPESLTAGGLSKKSFIYKKMEKISKNIYNSVDEIVVSSKSFEPQFRDILDEKIKISYIPQYAEKELVRGKNENRELNYVFAGNIGKAQNVEVIVKAANELKENNNIKIQIVGDGSSLNECKLLTEKYKLKNITFLGKKKIEEMQSFYDNADAMIVTLNGDDFALKTLPAKVQACMATGNAIIAAARGEVKNVIDDSKCGYCVNPDDHINLAKKIIEFSKLTNEEKEKMRENAYKYYQNNFDKNIFINKTIEILKKKGCNKNV